MAQTIQASELTLHDVKTKFGLQQVREQQFFREWRDDLPELTDAQKQWLDEIKADFLYLEEFPIHEKVVQLVVLAPLLSLAGLYRYPFHLAAEVDVRIALDELGEVVRGKIDVLVLREQMWVAVVESKRYKLSLAEAIPQALFYMMGNSETEKPTFGFVTNGSHFRFIKLVKQSTPQYALSTEFSLMREDGNELYNVLSVLKRLEELMRS